MGYILNSTTEYHISDLTTLGWEMTVVNALQPDQSPCRLALKDSASFGVHLFRFLEKHFPVRQVKSILEVGGGMGYLLKDLLRLSPDARATALDISPYLLQKQIEALEGLRVDFLEMDFLDMPAQALRAFDLIILNENIGDFPTLVWSDEETALPDAATELFLQDKIELEKRYDLPFSTQAPINIGALSIVEKICQSGMACAYISEHSCETSHTDPAFPSLNFSAAGAPEKIALKGHAEYTIQFSYLEHIARAHGYRVFRGPYIDILPLSWNDRVKTALLSATPISDEQEILQHFVYDLYKYEYLILISNEARGA